jgi:hypothetical protein
MPNLPATNHFQERVDLLIADWQGQDDFFYQSRSMQTIAWHFGKVKSLEQACAEIGKGERTKFMEAAATGYGIELRRLQEARQVYKHYHKPADSLMETCERVYQDVGGYSKAIAKLAAPKETVEEPKTCSHKCDIHQ